MDKVRHIPLTQGKYAIVDEDDFEYLRHYKWHYSHYGYAVRKPRSGVVWMHRLINKTPVGFETDHINRNRLDNRKCNLRTVTLQQNQFNAGLGRNNRSGYKGIGWSKQSNKWRVRIMIDYKEIHLGVFSNLVDAISARKKGELLYHGL